MSVAIVHFETPGLLRACLEAVETSVGGLAIETLVVDNGSRAFDRLEFERRFRSTSFVVNDTNRGFAAASNQALTQSQGRYVLLLNPDAIVEPSTLSTMVRFMDNNHDVGCSTARLVMADGRLDQACRRSFPEPLTALYRLSLLSRILPRSQRFGRYNLSFLDEHHDADIDSPCGAFMLVRREAYQQVGGLDERYFMYGEDLDWAYRLKHAGWRIVYTPRATVLHIKRAASNQVRTQSIRRFHDAMRVFYGQHYAARYPRPVSWLVRAGISLHERSELVLEAARRPLRRPRPPVAVRIEP